MKLNVAKGSGFESNGEVRSLQFGIDQQDTAVIIDILRNRLYTHKIRTLVQEYLCNARDANREAQSTKKVRVVLPTRLEPTLKIRDYGPGLSPERVATVFVKYGASTKRKSDTQTGGYGIGAKSAWSYTSQFIINSYHEGMLRSYIAHIGTSQSGSLDLVLEIPSEEPTGVEITILSIVEDIHEFHEAFFRATWLWPDRPELVGAEIIDIPAYYTSVQSKFLSSPRFAFVPATDIPNAAKNDGGVPHLILNLDGVPYRIPKTAIDASPSIRELSGLIYLNQYLILSAPNGAIEINATRESLSDAAKNIAVIEELCSAAVDELKAAISKELDEAVVFGEYLEKVAKINSLVSGVVKHSFNFGSDSISVFDGRYSYPALAELGIRQFLQAGRGKARMKIKTHPEDFTDFYSKAQWILNDSADSDAKIRAKITLQESRGVQACYVIHKINLDNSRFKNFFAGISFTCSSSMAIPKRTDVRCKKLADEVTVYSFFSSSHRWNPKISKLPRVRPISALTGTYCYMALDKGKLECEISDDVIVEMIALLKSRQCELICLPRKDILRVEKLPNFFSLQKQVAGSGVVFDLTPSHIARIKLYGNDIPPVWQTITEEQFKDCKDKRFLSVINLLQECQGEETHSYHRCFVEAFEKLSPLEFAKYRAAGQEAKALQEEISKDLTFLSAINFEKLSPEGLADLITCINGMPYLKKIRGAKK
jgi:hypothetical protein